MAKTPAVRRRSSRKDQHIAQMVFNQPWAIHEPKLREMLAVVRRHMAGARLTEDQLSALSAANESQAAPTRQGNGIVVIPVYGVVAYRMNMMTAISGGTSLQRLGALLEDAVNDAAISTIVMRYETPGGSVDGMTEMAAKIRELRGKGTKRFVGAIDVRALSAGYWLASQCDEICITPSGYAGAIGIIGEHCDDSESQKMEGEITEMISVPAKKAELQQPGPLSDEKRARILDIMGQFYTMFSGDVAKGRGISVARVNADFGGGDIMTATEAKAAGMVDRIETFEATLSRLGTRRGAMVSVRAMSESGTLSAETSEAADSVLSAEVSDRASIRPNDDGECEDGYELGADGFCHLIDEASAEDTTEPSSATTDTPQADVDAALIVAALSD